MKFNKLPPEFKDLEVGLKRLDLNNNFKSFEVRVTIPATTEVRIPNQMSPTVPTKRLVVRQAGGGLILDGGSAAWDKDAVYLYNSGADAATVTVVFLE